MPDRYDRALCATELRLRDDIISRISEGWRPQRTFDVPPRPSRLKEANDTSSCDSTSDTSTASDVARKKEAISDLYE